MNAQVGFASVVPHGVVIDQGSQRTRAGARSGSVLPMLTALLVNENRLLKSVGDSPANGFGALFDKGGNVAEALLAAIAALIGMVRVPAVSVGPVFAVAS